MTPNQTQRNFAILYVDDEPQALKYFRKALESDFDILTADSAEAAEKILDEHGARIGVVISDQRMPGQKGTDLLTRVRRDMPGVIRILTTAYSDLDSAIEAVNSGAIYKYIVKPWDLRDLRVTLLRAIEFHDMQRQRDQLMREKLSVLQRMLVVDRVRSLAVLAAGLSHHIRNSMSALKAFLDNVPGKLRDELESGQPRNEQFWNDLWSHAQNSSRDIFNMIDRIAANVVHPSTEFNDQVKVADLVEEATGKAREQGAVRACNLQVNQDSSNPELQLDRELAVKMLHAMLEHAATVNGGKGELRLDIADGKTPAGAEAVVFRLSGDGENWGNLRSEALFSPLDSLPESSGVGANSLLSAFFVAYHHGGEVHLTGKPGAMQLELTLPCDPTAGERTASDAGIFEHVFSVFDLDGDDF
jgi:two-component system, probable response regulator PhcQ